MAMLFLCLVLALLGHASSQCQTVEACGCPPQRLGCCLEVREGEPPITEVGLVDQISLNGVTDPVYSLQDTKNGTFSIDQSGVIFTQKTLDRETVVEELACISLGAGVNGIFEPVFVKVSDVNDNSPTFDEQEYIIDVPETTTVNPSYECTSEVVDMLTAEDLDEGVNAVVRYAVEGNPNFVVPSPALMPCVTNAPGFALDREGASTNHTFTLVAMNLSPFESLASRVTVTYVLQDLNDNSPVFDNDTYVLSVEENKSLHMEIFQFRATDIDLETSGQSGLTYSIRSGDGVFGINETSGVLFLTGPVDAEEEDRYDLEVFASDGENQGMADVEVNIVDVNEPASILFQGTEVHEIIENHLESAQGTTLATFTISDGDATPRNVGNTIEVIGGDGAFSIVNPFSDVHFLIQVQAIDFEQNETIELCLRTTERGRPVIIGNFSYNLTVLDVNDNRPSLLVTEFSVTEERPENQLIANLSQNVFDPDNGRNGTVGEYSLVSVTSDDGDVTDQFEGTLDPRTGELRTGSARIDREELGNSLHYTINLTDMGQPPLSQTVSLTVTIQDVDDNPPVFDRSVYMFSVAEGMPSGTPVGVVEAADRDFQENAIILYSIDEDSQFSINRRTGQIESGVEFDRETRDEYQFNVTASDTSQQMTDAIAVVTVLIVDIDDEDPVFLERQQTFAIDTSLRPGSEVGRVTARDEDQAPFNQSIYILESISSLFSIRNQSNGVITLESPLDGPGVFQLNVSAHNPGREDRKDTIAVIISVTEVQPLGIPLIAGVAGGATVLLVLIAVVIAIIGCTYCRSKRYNQYNMKEISNNLNNTHQQHPILKLPVASNSQQGRSRVTFKESVEETHYNQQSVIDTDNTVRKESITKFDNYPRSRLRYSAGDEPHVNPDGPESPNHLPTVVEMEMSPSHGLNGVIPPSRHMRGYEHSPHSPIVHVVPGGARGVVDLSQNTSSDGHTYLDDEESMYSDDASIVNADLSRYGNKTHDIDPRYRTPPTHMELHHHLPTMSHGEPTSSSLAQLHAHNLAQLAEANRQQHYAGSMHSSTITSEHNPSLTLTPLQHASISTQSTHTPSSLHDHAHSHTATSVSTNSNHIHSGGRNYPHPLIMPEAFPMDTTDIHRFPIGSYAEDYGEASTYASADLDEALGFNNSEAEPGIISLTATDYEDTEL